MELTLCHGTVVVVMQCFDWRGGPLQVDQMAQPAQVLAALDRSETDTCAACGLAFKMS